MTTYETRPLIHSMTPATETDDARYLDFVEGVRVFNQQQVQGRFKDRYAEAAAEFERTHGRPPSTIEDAHAMLDGIPLFASRSRLWRSTQEMMWAGVIETYRKREPELLAELDRADRSGPGSVEWDPNFVYPQYVQDHEIHIQPGSYHADPLAGYIYHYGTKIFFTPTIGNRDDDDNQRQMVNAMPLPADGVVRRVLDIGCSIGQSTTAWKERIPSAEVFGIDIAGPMVRYCHKRAIDLGLDVHFKQMAAEDLRFPDNSFDVVYSYILFHELPVPAIRATMRHAWRVLRPGGDFLINDFTGRTENPMQEWLLDFVTKDNGEPFAWDYCHLDLHAELRAAGFSDIRDMERGRQTVTQATK
jgi:ubiquinone/menaquinone biosynthesis C-methylase UbiE